MQVLLTVLRVFTLSTLAAAQQDATCSNEQNQQPSRKGDAMHQKRSHVSVIQWNKGPQEGSVEVRDDVIDVGGTKHKNGKAIPTKAFEDTPWVERNRVTRPEWQKDLRCTSESPTSCEECWSKFNCWRGSRADRSIAVNADGTGEWTRFISLTHVTCAEDILYLRVMPFRITNGLVHIYWDGVEITTENNFEIHGIQVSPMDSNIVRKSKGRVRLYLHHSGGHELAAIFTKPSGEQGSAQVSLRFFMANTFRQCEDHKACLEILGNTNIEEARHLRNSNSHQIACLKAEYENTAGICKEWRQCLRSSGDGHTSRILKILSVAGASEFAPTPSFSGNEGGASLCMNPELEDPESWDCDCFEVMQSQCQQAESAWSSLPYVGSDYSEFRCLRTLMCMHQMVCSDWKEQHCAEAWVIDMTTALRAAYATTSNLLEEHDVFNDVETKTQPWQHTQTNDTHDANLLARQTHLNRQHDSILSAGSDNSDATAWDGHLGGKLCN